MNDQIPAAGLCLISRLTDSGELELSVEAAATKAPGAGEVVIRVEAAPINPSDLGVLLGAADVSSATTVGEGAARRTKLQMPEAGRRAMAGRRGAAMPVGNEGAGIVVAAGEGAGELIDRAVAVAAGGMYGQYRTVAAAECLVLPEGVSPAQGASCFVNPLTALSMVENMRMEGHKALVHTAAASNLGQMLHRLCEQDGVPLVNIVRSPAQAALLKELGTCYVCDSSTPDFLAVLTEAVAETGATMAFDAIGGGRMASTILTAMESAAVRLMTSYNGYGSAVHKQVYLYGSLDTGPTELTRGFGVAWSIGGWLLPMFMQKLGLARMMELRARTAAEITTTFASHYTRTVTLADLLRPDILQAVARKAIGEKYLLTPASP